MRKMDEMDEMDRRIQLQAEEWGYKAALLALCLWTLYELCQSVVHESRPQMLPCLVLCFSLCVQGFSRLALKHRMTAGDEEYKEPNRFIHALTLSLVLLLALVMIGVFLLWRG